MLRKGFDQVVTRGTTEFLDSEGHRSVDGEVDVEDMIRRAIDLIHEQYRENLTLDDLANEAVMSKFHFIRSFQDVIGVTPCRFLSAFRLHEAKRLLRITSHNVSDIAVEVGYNSRGTFTRRFTESVGCTPIQYRRRFLDPQPAGIREASASHVTENHIWGMARGRALASEIYIGVFHGPIFERLPVATCILAKPGPFHLEGVSAGTWYVHAVAYMSFPSDRLACPERPLLVDRVGPIELKPGGDLQIGLDLQPYNWTHPPLLFARLLPEPWGVAA